MRQPDLLYDHELSSDINHLPVFQSLIQCPSTSPSRQLVRTLLRTPVL